MKNPTVLVSILIGIVLIIVSLVYFTTPADSLPHFFPGYSTGLTKHHLTHAVGTLVLGLAAFVFAWFKSGKKSSDK